MSVVPTAPVTARQRAEAERRLGAENFGESQTTPVWANEGTSLHQIAHVASSICRQYAIQISQSISG